MRLVARQPYSYTGAVDLLEARNPYYAIAPARPQAVDPMVLLLAGRRQWGWILRVTLVMLGLSLREGKSLALFGGPEACPVGAVSDEGPRLEDFKQEAGQGQVKVVRGNPP